jgi:Carboxypeptidase regulatory-like domain
MKRCPPPRVLAAIGAALLISLFAVSGFAQIQSGNIFGKVQAKDGSALPGVTVTLTGVGAAQTRVSDPTGAFRFINLSPGTYSLKAELSGFGTSTRQGISVNLGRNADVTMTLNPAAAESITVTAEAPLLDVRKTGTGADVTKVELEKVPSGRDPWVILQQTPGVLLDRINVGGNESGQQSGYTSKGTIAAQSTWNVDGVNITDVGALGSTPTYYDFDSFEEMQITTGGVDPRIMTPGVQLNMVTKRGTNDVKGSARWFHTSQSLQATPKIPTEASAYLAHVNQIDKIDDEGVEIGGPIIKDKLWLWGAYADQKIDLLTATLLSSGARFLDKTELKSQNLKVNAQPTTSNSLAGSILYGNKVKIGRNVGPSRAPETAWNQANSYGGKEGNLLNPTMWKIEDTQIFGPNLYLTGLYSKVQGGFQLIADNGNGCKTVACGLAVAPAYLGADGSWHRSYESYLTDRPQKQYRVDGSTFANTGGLSHEFKFGFGYRDAKVFSDSEWPGQQYVTEFGNADGGTGGVQLFRPTIFTYGVKSTDAYVGDTMMMGNLTIQAALRYDQQKGNDSGGTVSANPTIPDLLPSITWGGTSGLKWTTVDPRVGLTYTLGTQRRTLLRAAYSRYTDQMGGGEVLNASPGAYQYLYYYFNDLNHDHQAQRNEIDFAYGLVGFGGLDPTKALTANQVYRWNTHMTPPKTDEFIFGGEHELMTDLSVGANVTYRKLKDFIWYDPEKTQGSGNYYTSADYHLAGTKTATLPNGTKVSMPYYALNAGTHAPIYYVVTNRPDYGQTYKGLELNLQKRMSNRWMMRANVTLQDWTQQVGSRAIIDPTPARGATGCTTCNGSDVIVGAGSGSGSKGGVYINSKWAYNLTGAYQIPVVETSLGFNVTGRQGYAIPYVYRQFVGAPAGVSAPYDVLSEGYKYLMATSSPTEFRQPNLTEVDLRLAKDLRFNRVGLTLSVDAFNILNSQTVLQRDVRRLQLASSNHITELQSPRVFRLGARFNF